MMAATLPKEVWDETIGVVGRIIPPVCRFQSILWVDAVSQNRRPQIRGLVDGGYNVVSVSTPKEALETLDSGVFHAAILRCTAEVDVVAAVLGSWRRGGHDMPVIVFGQDESSAARISALDAGADRYLSDPLDPAELASVLQALLRRAEAVAKTTLSHRSIRMSCIDRTVHQNNRLVQLEGREFDLLECFLRQPLHIKARGYLCESVFGRNDLSSENLLNTYINRLRKRLRGDAPDESIETIRGVGYRLL